MTPPTDSLRCPSCGALLGASFGPCPRCGDEEAHAARADVLLGLTVGARFRVLRRLGEGGSGTTYLAELPGAGPRVALKVFHPAVAREAALVRHVREAPARLASLAHPGAVRVLDAGQDTQGRLLLVHAHVEGRSLGATVRARGRLDTPEAVARTLEVAEVLAAAHAQGLLHGALSADSVLLSTGTGAPRAVVLGVGVLPATCRRALADAGLEVPEALAPEQRAGTDVDARADVHALGLLLFELLTGRRVSEVAGEGATASVPSLAQVAPDVALPALDAVLQRATARERDARFPTVEVFVRALRQAVPSATASPGGVPADEDAREGPTPPPGERRTAAALADLDGPGLLTPTLPRGSVWVGLTVAALLVLGAGAWMLLRGAGVPDAARVPAGTMASPAPTAPGVVPAGGQSAPPTVVPASHPRGTRTPAPDVGK